MMILIIGIVILLTGTILSISKLGVLKFKNNKIVEKRDNEPNYAILIPARDESKVIEKLLISIKNQTRKIDMKDVYVIVEDRKDKTENIANNYKATVIVRKKLNLKRKGYALMEGVEAILGQNKEYDAYFIFDADNVLDKNYLKEMTKIYKEGYDIGIGYRNSKNGDYNAIATASSLTFTVINTVVNSRKTQNNQNSTISGTGFYICKELIETWKTFPFHTLTEDYELTLYTIINDISTKYTTKAVFYDEQPITYRQYKTQRVRWIKGYFEARKKYKKQLIKKLTFKNKNFASVYYNLIGVWDLILILVGLALIIIDIFIKAVVLESKLIILMIVVLLLLIYIVLALYTVYLLFREKGRFKLSLKTKIKTVFLHPLLLLAYISCVIEAMCKKDLKWEIIEHGN